MFPAAGTPTGFTRAAAKVCIGQPPLSPSSTTWKERSGSAVPSLGPRRGAYGGRQGVFGRCDDVDRGEGDYGWRDARPAARRDRCMSASPHRPSSTSWYRLPSVPFGAPIPVSTSRSRRQNLHPKECCTKSRNELQMQRIACAKITLNCSNRRKLWQRQKR
jgi:hypothetical protein